MLKRINKKITKFLNEESKFNLKDLITILIIVTLYATLSFINLGDIKNPNTFINGIVYDKLIIELEEPDDVIQIKIFSGYNNSRYNLSVANEQEEYDYVGNYIGRGSFSWDIIKPKKKAKYVELEFTDDSSIGEIALYNNSKEKIKIKSIKFKDKEIKELTDEQSTVPKKVSYMNTTYFDEIYFARTAYEYVNNIPTYEWTHPPLGKLIQAIPIYLTNNMSPFNFRLMGNISGILMLVVMYLFGKELFKKRKYSIIASLLMFFDTFHFAHTRMGTVDSHLVLFIMISVLGMIKFCNSKKSIYLLLSGIFFGLSVCVKWTGLYCGLGLAIIYFTYMFRKHEFDLKHILQGFSFFVVIPLIFYIGLYLLFPNNNLNYTNNFKSIIKQQEEMYNYHSKLNEPHHFSSEWYTWPVSYKPVWYHQSILDENTKETISGIGNIVIWWYGIIAMLYLIPKLIKKKDKNSFYLLIMILSLWLPYVFIGRVMFLYHYFPVVPFMMLSLVLLMKEIAEKHKMQYLIPIYFVFVIAFFIIYFPIISGSVVSNKYIEIVRLFTSWNF